MTRYSILFVLLVIVGLGGAIIVGAGFAVADHEQDGSLESPDQQVATPSEDAPIGQVAASKTNETAYPDSNPDEQDTDIGFGSQLSGVIQLYAVDAEVMVRERTIAQQFQQVETDEERSESLREWIEELEDRITDLEAEEEVIESEYQDGTLSAAEYRLRMAELERERSHLIRQLIDSELIAQDLPVDALEEAGLEDAEIRMLQDRATRLGGTNASESAAQFVQVEDSETASERSNQRITGEDRDIGDAERYVDRAAEIIEQATSQVERADRAVDDTTSEDLERAKAALDEAETTLDEAMTAFDNEEYQETVRQATNARAAGADASALAEDVIERHTETDPEEAQAAIGTAETDLATVEGALSNASEVDLAHDQIRELLADARVEFQRGNEALDHAQDALEENRHDRAISAAETATDHATRAKQYLKRIRDIDPTEPADEDEAFKSLTDAREAIEEADEIITMADQEITDHDTAESLINDAKATLERAKQLETVAAEYFEAEEFGDAAYNAESSMAEVTEAIELTREAVERAGIDPPDDRDDDERAEDAIESAETTVDAASTWLDRAAEVVEDDDEDAMAKLDDAQAAHQRATEHQTMAKEEFEAGNYEEAIGEATDAEAEANQAISLVEDALDLADDDDDEDYERIEVIDDAEEAIFSAEEAIERAIEEVDDDEDAQAYVEQAQEAFDRSVEYLLEADAALEDGDDSRAESLAHDSIDYAEDAEAYAERAIREASE